jgi:hypothetical protein
LTSLAWASRRRRAQAGWRNGQGPADGLPDGDGEGLDDGLGVVELGVAEGVTAAGTTKIVTWEPGWAGEPAAGEVRQT